MLKNQYKKGIEVGLDEAGRGCLAGPVVAAAVILPKNTFFPELKDSKKTTFNERIILRKKIEKIALDIKISIINSDEIDRINILNATLKAMHNCLSKLSIKPTYIIVDGNMFKKYKKIPHYCIIKGDINFPSSNPNLNHNLFKGGKIIELINPNIKKIKDIINDHNLMSPSLIIGYNAIIKKTIKKTIPKLLFELVLICFSI